MITLQQIQVPPEFRCHQLRPYPQDNFEPFEEWFYQHYSLSPEKWNVAPRDREYLPIFWTSYYGNNKHGKDRRALRKLQEFIDRIDRSKKYFSICQNDDGILNNVSHLDIKIFGMGCKSSEGTAQLPLVCQPHKYEFKETGRPIFASFIGSITHPIREQMVKELQGKEGYFISTEPTSLHSYCYIMTQSKYVLCPRGYGFSSFRIQECLQYGAVPVYISDEFLFSEGCVEVIHSDINFYLNHFLDNYNPLPEFSKEVFENHYTYEAVANRIYENLQL